MAFADLNEAIRLYSEGSESYTERALVYAAEGDFARAAADLDQSLRFESKKIRRNYGPALRLRDLVYLNMGEFNMAVAKYDEAIKLDGSNSDNYSGRGRALLFKGDAGKAVADLRKASDLAPDSFYNALRLSIAERRDHGSSQSLPQQRLRYETTQWPGPLIRFFLGEITEAEVRIASDDPDPIHEREKSCDADFFIGEFLLLQGAKDEAVRLFRSAASECPKLLFEFTGATAELKSLGATP